MQSFFKRLHHLFIPSDRNNYRARLLHIDFLTGIIAIVALVNITVHTLSGIGVLGLATDITVQRLYELTNRQRVEHGLSALDYNSELAQAAQKKAEDMFAKNYWAHYSPTGGTPWEFIVGAGYKYEFAGENLAHGFMFSDQVVEAWMQSDSHRANLLKSEYEEIGFAVVNGTLQGEPTTLVVQMFGRPLVNGSDNTADNSQNIAVAAAEREAEKPKPTSPKATPEAEFVSSNEPVEGPGASSNGISMQSLTFNSSIWLIVLLILALLIDLIYASRHRLLRITGKNLAHLTFLLVILVAVIMLAKGVIL